MAQRDWFEKDYYGVLGVDPKTSKDDIKRAYRKLAQQYHPDANKGDAQAETRFKEISEAHAILSNDDKRREYDQVRAFAQSGGRRFYGFTPGGQGSVRVNIGDLFGDEGDIGSIFEEAFGFGPRGSRRGADVETEVMLPFEAAVNGTTVDLPNGTRARIPAGMRDGARIKLAGKGGESTSGGRRGDLYVRIRVEDHPVFELAGNGNLKLTLPVTFPEAALGAKIEIPTLDGSVTLKIPAGTPNGKTLRIKGRGGPRAGGGAGDLLATVQVEVPQKLSRKEKELLEQFSVAHGASPRAHLEEQLKSKQRRVS